MAKPLIMIVEDEADVASEISDTIKESGKYDAVIAYSAEEAFKLLEKNKRLFGKTKNKIRCIILDIKLPKMDGLDFLKELRTNYEESIGVIIVSAYEDPEKWNRALKNFVSGYILKPLKREELFEKIDCLFTSPSIEDAEARLITETLDKGIKRIEKLAGNKGEE